MSKKCLNLSHEPGKNLVLIANPDLPTEFESGSDCEDADPAVPECEGVEIISDTEQNIEDEDQDNGIQFNQSHPKVEPSESSFNKQNDSHGVGQEVGVIVTHVCLFNTFFQLCYKVTERGITLLLNFLRAILLWLTKYIRESVDSLCRNGTDTPIVRVRTKA